MSGYEWKGSGQHGGFVRAGSRRVDRTPNVALYRLVADKPFWCDNCGGTHALSEHRICRGSHPFRSAMKGG